MSGLKKVLPWTNMFMLVGCLALAGFPFFSGFFSKDEIVAAAFRQSPAWAIILLLAAFLTAYYTFRLYFRVFQGPLVVPPPPAPPAHQVDADHDHGHGHDDAHDRAHGHAEEHHHNHEPLVMILPLALLTIGALLRGVFELAVTAIAGFPRQEPLVADELRHGGRLVRAQE